MNLAIAVSLPVVLGALSVIVAVSLAIVWWLIRQRNLQKWLGSAIFSAEPRLHWQPTSERPLELLIAICDHYEPEWNRPGLDAARQRVARWLQDYPVRFAEFQDSFGRPPQHTFFFPQDEYRPEYLDGVAKLCAAGFGDVEIHLHHDHDTAAALHDKLAEFRDTLFHRHGLLRKDATGRIVYGFIHGNWALCNSRPDGRWCGVDQELTVLLNTGCYADFTMPSAPDITQVRTINSIYYAKDRPGQRASHSRGIRARAGQAPPADQLLMIQGPLALDWGDRKFGLLPRIENGDVTKHRPGSLRRLEQWIQQGVHVAGAPETVFIKLHTHGCNTENLEALLGPETVDFHRNLATFAATRPWLRYRYVTAWEMAQRVHQIEAAATCN